MWIDLNHFKNNGSNDLQAINQLAQSFVMNTNNSPKVLVKRGSFKFGEEAFEDHHEILKPRYKGTREGELLDSPNNQENKEAGRKTSISRKPNKRHYSYLSSLKPRKTILKSAIWKQKREHTNLKVHSKIRELNNSWIASIQKFSAI